MKSRQKQGRITEKKMAKDRGARLHPMSGAGSIKSDASTEDVLYEFKDANKTHTISGAELLALWKWAVQQDKEAQYVVYFTDSDLTLEGRVTKGHY